MRPLLESAAPGPSPPQQKEEGEGQNERGECWDSDSDCDEPVVWRRVRPWARTGSPARPKAGAHRLLKALEIVLKRGELQFTWNTWRLNATRARAASLAVWAVDCGNRKAWEVERALRTDNGWATRSVVWDGYSRTPLVGVTDSGWFWAAGQGSKEQLGAALEVAKNQNSVLKVQLEAARAQLIEWQELCDFRAGDDGSWQSGRLSALQTEVGLLKRQIRAKEEEGSSKECGGVRPTAHQSQREVISTIPGLGEPSEPGADMESQREVISTIEGYVQGSKEGDFINEADTCVTDLLMRHAARDIQAIRRADLEEVLEATQKNYTELREFSHLLEDRLVETLAKLDLAMEGECNARLQLQEVRSAMAREHRGPTSAKDLPKSPPPVDDPNYIAVLQREVSKIQHQLIEKTEELETALTISMGMPGLEYVF